MSDDGGHPAELFFALLILAGTGGLLFAGAAAVIEAVVMVQEIHGDMAAALTGVGIASAVLLTGIAGIKWFDNRE